MAKSRVDKAGKAGANAPTPAQVHEIIPGKFTDHDWNLLLDKDEGDDFVADIVEELCGNALDIIYKSYIEKQLIPYTVTQAKDAIVQIIEWQFLAQDGGEGDVSADPGWIEDEEPSAAETDCWAQGSVPRQLVTPRPVTAIQEVDDAQEEEETQEEAPVEVATPPPPRGIEHERTIIEEESTLIVEGTSLQTDDLSQGKTQLAPEPPSTKKPAFRPHYGPLRSAGVKKMTESLEHTEMKMWMDENSVEQQIATPGPEEVNMPASCHSILKLQAGRPPGKRDVFYDEYGNVVSVKKILPEKLPNHKISTRYRIVDPEVEAAQDRLDAMRTGRYVHQAKAPRAGTKQRDGAKTAGTTTHTQTGMSVTGTARTSQSQRTGGGRSRASHSSRSPLPPHLIDQMEVMPGVVVREGDRVKRGPKQRGARQDLITMALQNNQLHAIRLNSHTSNQITVADLLDSTPTVRPIVDQRPIPPIASQQQSV